MDSAFMHQPSPPLQRGAALADSATRRCTRQAPWTQPGVDARTGCEQRIADRRAIVIARAAARLFLRPCPETAAHTGPAGRPAGHVTWGDFAEVPAEPQATSGPVHDDMRTVLDALPSLVGSWTAGCAIDPATRPISRGSASRRTAAGRRSTGWSDPPCTNDCCRALRATLDGQPSSSRRAGQIRSPAPFATCRCALPEVKQGLRRWLLPAHASTTPAHRSAAGHGAGVAPERSLSQW